MYGYACVRGHTHTNMIKLVTNNKLKNTIAVYLLIW